MIWPLIDVDRGSRPPAVVTWVLIVAMTAVFAAAAVAQGGVFLDHPVLERWGALEPGRVADGEWWRLLASGLLHKDVVHLGTNLLAIALFAPLLERALGSRQLFLIWLVTTLCGSASGLPLYDGLQVGSSAFAYGLLGAGLAVVGMRLAAPPPTLAARLGLVSLLAMGSLREPDAMYGEWRVSHAAHIAGMLAGLVLGLVAGAMPRARVRRGQIVAALIATLACAGVLLTPRRTDFQSELRRYGAVEADVRSRLAGAFSKYDEEQDAHRLAARIENEMLAWNDERERLALVMGLRARDRASLDELVRYMTAWGGSWLRAVAALRGEDPSVIKRAFDGVEEAWRLRPAWLEGEDSPRSSR